MNVFDKACAVFAFILGVVLLLLGIVGLFVGCRANFSLPPILGALPALAGWGICKCIVVAWNSHKGPTSLPSEPQSPNANPPSVPM